MCVCYDPALTRNGRILQGQHTDSLLGFQNVRTGIVKANGIWTSTVGQHIINGNWLLLIASLNYVYVNGIDKYTNSNNPQKFDNQWGINIGNNHLETSDFQIAEWIIYC